jgi:hypothetical protein
VNRKYEHRTGHGTDNHGSSANKGVNVPHRSEEIGFTLSITRRQLSTSSASFTSSLSAYPNDKGNEGESVTFLSPVVEPSAAFCVHSTQACLTPLVGNGQCERTRRSNSMDASSTHILRALPTQEMAGKSCMFTGTVNRGHSTASCQSVSSMSTCACSSDVAHVFSVLAFCR